MSTAIWVGQSLREGVSIFPLTGISPVAISQMVTPICKAEAITMIS